MQDNQEKIKRKATKVVENGGSVQLAHLDATMELADKMEELTNPERVQKMEIMGAEVITIKGAKGDKGDSPSKEELISLIEPLIPEPIKGDNGNDYILTKKDKLEIAKSIKVPVVEKVIEKTETIIEKPTVTEVVKEVAKYQTADEIANLLESLEGDARLSVSAIKGIDFVKTKDFEMAMSTFKGFMPYGNGSSSSVGGVSSVSNSDGTLTISPTTGAVVASLNLGKANTWVGQQTFSTSAPIFSTMTAGSVLFAGTSGLLSQDNTNFFWDDTLDILKLGGGTPTYTLANTQSMAMTKAIAGFYLPFAGQNTDNGTTSSTDITLSNNLGTDTTNYLDIGINSSTNTDPAYTGFSAGSGYMYNQSGDLVLATASAKDINFLTGGTLAANRLAKLGSDSTFRIYNANVETFKFSGATTSPLLTMTAASGSNNAKLWFTGQGNGTDLIVGSSNAASYPTHAYMIAASNTLTIQGGTSAAGRINFNSTLGFADQKAWQSSNSRQFFMVSENTGNAQARVTFGPTIFSPTGTTESFFTWNGAVNGVAGSTVALAGIRQSQTITPNAATPLIIGYQMINSMVATANNQTFVGIDLSSTFTPGAFTGLTAIRLRIGAGSTTTVPVQFTSGSLATTALVGGMEFLTDKWYGTITTGTARKEFTMNDIALTSGQVPYVTTNGRLTSNSSMTFDGSGNLGISGAFAAGSYTDFSNTKSGTDNGITASITNQLSSTTVTVTALSATAAQAGIVDTSAQTYAGRKTFDDGITIGASATATLRLKGYTVAGLPAGTVGDVAYVTDGAAAPVYMAVVAGGGTTVTKVFFDGTNWINA